MLFCLEISGWMLLRCFSLCYKCLKFLRKKNKNKNCPNNLNIYTTTTAFSFDTFSYCKEVTLQKVNSFANIFLLQLVSAIFLISSNDNPWKLWKMLFMSYKKLFSFSKYSIFCISPSPYLTFLSAIAPEDDWRYCLTSWEGN